MKEKIKSINHNLIYGSKTINYKLLYSERKTLEITVQPDCSIIVKTPTNADFPLLENKIRKQARWILKQINYFNQFNPKTPERSYINGETHLYLGKQYRLKISRENKNNVKLIRGFFQITCCNEPTPEKVRKLLDKWYLEKAHLQFNAGLIRCFPKFKKFNFSEPKISIRKMKRRWGCLSYDKKITLNTNLVKAPKECIDYVIMHELCHLKYRNHNRDFYCLLTSILPEWEKIKHKLELSMI